MLTSHLCVARDFTEPWYAEVLALLHEGPLLHRKQWEFVTITQALRERGFLRPGSRGLGFAVGGEPLPALFASLGAQIVATDQPATDEAERQWGEHQLARGLADLNARELCPAHRFRERVEFRPADMRALPTTRDLGTFDFLWSAGSLEHLGGLQAGIEFVVAALRFLRPGGLAVHTTEYCCSSETETLDGRHLCLYRRSDLESLSGRLWYGGDRLNVDLDQGDMADDQVVAEDALAAGTVTLPHLKLRIGEHVTTSLLLIVEKGT